MAIGTASRAPSATAPEMPDERFIEQQLDKTRSQLKVNDLFAAALLFVAGVLAFFLTVAVVDHWILGLGFWTRWAALVTLVAGSSVFFVQMLLPLLLHRINPAYAARAIERNTPSLKNSLLNFWLLRGTRGVVHDVVYQALGQRVAADLSHVPVESSVDRTKLFRLGWVLVGLIAVAAAYKLFSPKDPWQTAARVIAPWANIVRPSRVKIEDVQPGDQKVFYGQTVKVSARISVHGVGDPGPVTLHYTTADGQVIDRVVPLAASPDGLRYECQLPPSGDGVQQDLVYRIAAGDTLTPDFKIAVLPAPTILIDRIDYDFPTYTSRPKQSVPRHGDIMALEGTRVTIVAKANQAIQTAYIEFDPARGERREQDTPASANKVLPMKVSDHEASATFVLELAADRKAPQHSSYQLRFTTVDGYRNEQPIVHQIEVTPDLPPEVEILTPEKDRLDVPENGRQKIEIRGVDPDFGLSKITLRAVVRGNDLLTHELLADSTGRLGQAVVSFDFDPRELRLAVGDEVTYWAVVEDNRVGPRTGLPEPNSQRTRNYLIRVVKSDDARKQPAKDEPGEKEVDPQANDPNDKPPPKNPRDDSKDEKNNKKSKRGDSGDPSDKSDDGAPNDRDAPDKKQGGGGSKDQQDDKGNGKQKNTKQNGSGGQASKGNSNDKSSGDPENSGGEPGSEGDSSGAKPKGNGSGGKNGKEGNQKSSQNSPAKPDSGDSKSESDPSEQSINDSQQAGGAASQQRGAGGKPAGDVKPGDAAGNPSDNDSGNGPREPQHDGEVIEKALEHLRQQQQAKGKNGAANGEPASPQSGDLPAGDSPTAGNSKSRPEQDGRPGDSPRDPKNPSGSAGSKDEQRPGEQGQPQPKPNDKGDGAAKTGQPQGGEGTGQKQPMDANGGNAAKPGEKPDQSPAGKNGDSPRNPDQKHGVSPKNSQAAGNPGGKPQGPAETKPGDQPRDKQPDGKETGGEGDNGDAGAGQESKDTRGAPQAQDDNRDRKKPTNPADSKPSDADEAQSPSTSKKQSDSQSDSAGDQSGGGKKGGGQGANQKGNDSAGSNSAADEGAGQANDPGQGETSGAPGDKKKSARKTGKPGQEPGPGSGTRPQDGNSPQNSPDGKSGKPSAADSASPGSQPSQQPPSGAPQTASGGNVPTGAGGVESINNPPAAAPPPAVDGPGGDEANLEFARRATDLALEHLKDQKDNPDRELLDKLGWTKEDLQKFIERWEAMKRSAAEKDSASKRDLDESLRSLGLRPNRDKKRAGGGPNDSIRGNRDAGNRSNPPPQYRDQFDAFRKGASRSSDK